MTPNRSMPCCTPRAAPLIANTRVPTRSSTLSSWIVGCMPVKAFSLRAERGEAAAAHPHVGAESSTQDQPGQFRTPKVSDGIWWHRCAQKAMADVHLQRSRCGRDCFGIRAYAMHEIYTYSGETPMKANKSRSIYQHL